MKIVGLCNYLKDTDKDTELNTHVLHHVVTSEGFLQDALRGVKVHHAPIVVHMYFLFVYTNYVEWAEKHFVAFYENADKVPSCLYDARCDWISQGERLTYL